MSEELVKQESGIVLSEAQQELEQLKHLAKTDFATTRNNVLRLINDGMVTLQEVREFCEMSQDIRWYRVFTELMRAVSENNKSLIDITATYKNIIVEKGSKATEEVEQVTNNNTLIIGSTVELQKMLEEKLKGTMDMIENKQPVDIKPEEQYGEN